MLRTVKTAGIALLALLTLVPAASAQRRVVVSGRFGFGRPVPYYPYAYRAWWPGWDWGWGPYYAPQQVPATGEVKLISPLKDASVYVDGGFAGRADKLKKFALPLGTHDIQLRDQDGQVLHQERVQVIRGKTVEVNAG
jgi:hypothetical protein